MTATGSPLYDRTMRWAAENLDAEGVALQHKVWDGTPWMVSAFTGPMAEDREREMINWCREHLGDECWPIHGRPGAWQRGGATVYGWTWFGFQTREMMERFEAAWPAPEGVVADQSE